MASVSRFRLLLPEGQPQAPTEPGRRLALIGRQADGHALMPGLRLRKIGPEQTVPERQVEAVVPVVLAIEHRVVHAMHVRRDDEEAQCPVEPCGERNVGVVEHGAGVENDLEQEHRERRSAERYDHGDLPQHGERDLDRVKAHRRGDVDIAVGVVHLMQPPEDRHFVRDEMLKPDGEVEHEQRDHELDPIRPVDLIEQAEPPLLGEERRGDRRHRHRERRHQPQHQRVDAGDAEIGEPAPRL